MKTSQYSETVAILSMDDMRTIRICRMLEN